MRLALTKTSTAGTESLHQARDPGPFNFGFVRAVFPLLYGAEIRSTRLFFKEKPHSLPPASPHLWESCSRTTSKKTKTLTEVLRTQEDGSNLIEMALVLPMYFMLVFGIITLSIVLFVYCNATYASRAAVRFAMVHGASSFTPCSATDLQNIVTPYLLAAPAGGVTITPAWSPANTIGSVVSVTVVLNYGTGMPFGFLDNLQLSTTAQGVILQ